MNQRRTKGHRYKIYKKRFRLDVRKHFFPNRVVDEWNALPNNVVDSTSVNQFKNCLDEHFKKQGRCVRHHNIEGQFMKSTITMMSQEVTDVLYIEAFSNIGFTMSNKVRVVGPIAIFPRSILHWNVGGPEDINEESLSLFALLVPKIDILILGCGDAGAVVNPSALRYLRKKNIQIEVLTTEHACSTFNFLNAERRCIAGALIPPTNIDMNDDDSIDAVLSTSFNHDVLRFKEGPDFKTKDFEMLEEVEEKLGKIEREKLEMKQKKDSGEVN